MLLDSKLAENEFIKLDIFLEAEEVTTTLLLGQKSNKTPGTLWYTVSVIGATRLLPLSLTIELIAGAFFNIATATVFEISISEILGNFTSALTFSSLFSFELNEAKLSTRES